MIKSKTILEIKIEERTYELMCSPDSPLGELHDVLSSMRAFVIQKINESHEVKENEEIVQSCCI